MSGFDNVPVVTRRGLHRRKSFSSLSVAALILSIISLVLSCFSLLVYQGIQHVEVYSRGLNVTPRTAGKEDWLRRFCNSAVECMADILGYSKSQIADATSGMFNSIIRLA